MGYLKPIILGATFLLALLSGFVSAASGPLKAISTAELQEIAVFKLNQIVELLYGIIAPVAIIVFVIAGLIYAVGQVFDAQTRNKAQAWSISMITGAVTGVLIAIIAPWLVEFLMGFGAA